MTKKRALLYGSDRKVVMTPVNVMHWINSSSFLFPFRKQLSVWNSSSSSISASPNLLTVRQHSIQLPYGPGKNASDHRVNTYWIFCYTVKLPQGHVTYWYCVYSEWDETNMTDTPVALLPVVTGRPVQTSPAHGCCGGRWLGDIPRFADAFA